MLGDEQHTYLRTCRASVKDGSRLTLFTTSHQLEKGVLDGFLDQFNGSVSQLPMKLLI